MINNKRDKKSTIFLPKNRKGLSTIIVTVLLIGLTIVAVGIVWAVVNSTLQRGSQSTDLGVKCLDIQVTATSVTSCAGALPTTCVVRLERTGSRDDVISGVKLVFENASGSRTVTPLDAGAAGQLTQLGNSVTSALSAGISAPSKVETTVYFTDASGNIQYCPQPNIFTF